MTSRVIQLLICYLILSGQLFAAEPLQEVMQALSKVERSDTGYREEKHLAMLDIPLVQTGSLSYIAPDQFSRSVDGPHGIRFVVRGDQVILEKKKGGREVHDLNSLPMVKAFIASFGATLAGDLSRLQQYYEVSFSGRKKEWKMKLKPRVEGLASYVREIILSGAGEKISSMEIYETNNDWSRMILLHD